MRKRKVTPRQAMSARQVDRIEKELVAILDDLKAYRFGPRCCHACRTQGRLTRLLASVRRSERR